MLIVKNIENKTMYNVQYARTAFIIIFIIFTSLAVSVHSSTSLSTNFFLHLQFL